MNIKQLHTEDKPVSAITIFKSDMGQAASMRILRGELLQEHVSKIPALLVCIEGEAVFENETGLKETLKSGDYVNIEPMVKHWVKGMKESQLLLIK